MKNFINKYFYQSIAIGLLIIVTIVSGFGFLLTHVLNATPGYIGADDKIVMSTGDATMSLDEAIFLTKNKQAYYEAYYLSAGTALDWNIDFQDGKTFQEVVLEESLQLVKEVFLFSEYAKANGYQLTAEEEKAISSDIQAFMKDSAPSIISATGASMDLLKRIYTRNAYYDKVCEKIYEDANITVDDEEVKQCLVSIVEISPSAFQSPKQTANKIMERVNNGEVIGEVAEKYDAKATKGNVGKGTLDGNELETYCLSLKDGECKVTEIDGTYYVVYCFLAYDEDATAKAKELKVEKLENEAKQAFFDELIKTMPIEVVDSAWSTITFDQIIFTKEDLKNSALTK